MVADEDRLYGLVGDDTLLALLLGSVSGRAMRCGGVAYLLGLERVVGCLDGHVLLAADLDSVRNDALGVALVVEGIGNSFAFSVGDLIVPLACELNAVAVPHAPPHPLWQLSGMAACRLKRWRTYGEAIRHGPDGASSGITDDGFVDVTGAYEAAAGSEHVIRENVSKRTSGRCMLFISLALRFDTCHGCSPCQDMMRG